MLDTHRLLCHTCKSQNVGVFLIWCRLLGEGDVPVFKRGLFGYRRVEAWRSHLHPFVVIRVFGEWGGGGGGGDQVVDWGVD